MSVVPRRGRGVAHDIVIGGVPLLGPKGQYVGDRLEHVESDGRALDVHSDISDLPAYPARLVFYRPRTWVVAPNCLFDFLLLENIVFDVLHVLDLGVVQSCVGWILVMLLFGDVYETGATTQDGLLSEGVGAMKASLFRWYRSKKPSGRVSDLTVGMILGTDGTVYRPCLRAKGAEPRGLLFLRNTN